MKIIAWIPISDEITDESSDLDRECISHYSFKIEDIQFLETLPEDTFTLRGMGAVDIPIYDHFSGEPRRFDTAAITNEIFEETLAKQELALKSQIQTKQESPQDETANPPAAPMLDASQSVPQNPQKPEVSTARPHLLLTISVCVLLLIGVFWAYLLLKRRTGA